MPPNNLAYKLVRSIFPRLYFKQLNIGNERGRNYKALNYWKKPIGNSEKVLEITTEKY